MDTAMDTTYFWALTAQPNQLTPAPAPDAA